MFGQRDNSRLSQQPSGPGSQQTRDPRILALVCRAHGPTRRRYPTIQAEMKQTVVASHAESTDQEWGKKTTGNILAWALVRMVQEGRRFRGRLKQLIALGLIRGREMTATTAEIVFSGWRCSDIKR